MPGVKHLFSILLCVFAITSHAQNVHLLTNNPALEIKSYDVLPDKNYNFNQILSLPFKQAGELKTSGTDYYWIKMVIENPYPNDESYRISLSLPLNYTLYLVEDNTWKSNRAGLAVPDKRRERGTIPCILKGNTKNVLYFKIDIRDIQSYGYNIKPTIILEKSISADSREDLLRLSWMICIIVLASFLCYNLYIYFHLKDSTYLYYLMAQIGAIIFITSFKHFFNVLLPFGIYNIRLNEDGSIFYYGLNALFLHIGLAVLIPGMIQLTRSFLQTKELLPVYDKILKYLCYIYIALELIPAIITITGVYYLDSYTLLYDNIAILIITSTIVTTNAVAYKRKVRAAKYFLLANTLPIIFATATAIYFIINAAPTYTNNTSVMPEMAILSQIFTFGVALIARVRVVNDELKIKELEIEKLEADIEITGYKRLLIEQENDTIIAAIQQEKDKNEALQQKLEANQRELVSNSLYIHQKNKLLADLKSQLHDIDSLYPHVKHPGLKGIKSSLKDSQYLDAEWDKFKLHFEQVHPDFFTDLRNRHPSLTNNELRLYAYFHINLSTKEIAALLSIEPASVRQAKARLNKKMGNLTGAIQSN
jgi:hypothetical protein